MAGMLEQTKRAVKAMKAAGFARSEFSARTYLDPKTRGYGDCKVTIWDSQKALDLVDAMADTGDLDIDVYIFADGKRMPFVFSGTGRVMETDESQGWKCRQVRAGRS